MLNKFSKSVFIMIILYMTLPIIIFIFGWIKLWIAIPLFIAIGYALFKMFKNLDGSIGLPLIGKKEIETMVLAFLIIILWVYFSGIGKFVFQNPDHLYRNAIFDILVKDKWPIIKDFEVMGVHKSFIFVYYIGFWMPSALVGKIFGLYAGYTFQVIWAAIGIWMFYYLLSCYLKKVSLLPLIVFIFFSGLDIIGNEIMSGAHVSIFSGRHIEWYALMQFSSFTTQLFWVFNQAIPAWILTMLIVMQKRNRYIVFVLGTSLIFCPLPFIGVMPIVVYIMVRNAWSAGNIKDACKDLFTIENILGGGITGIITYLYFKTNSSGQHIVFVPSTVAGTRGFVFDTLFFILLEVGVYVICVYKYQKKNPLLYLSLIFLCTCPLIQIGYGSDYCMRASIPCGVILFLLVIESLYSAKRNSDALICISIAVILLIGSVTPIHEINRTIQNTEARYRKGVPVFEETYTDEELMMSDNFRGEMNDTVFIKYLMKTKSALD